MKVELLTSQETLQDMESFAVRAAQICYGNEGKEVNAKEFLLRIIVHGHESILEHINFTFRVEGISRAVLQELARHRHISLSVESTRHTLKKYLSSFLEGEITNTYLPVRIIFPENNDFGIKDLASWLIASLSLAMKYQPSLINDELKYYLPEFWPTKLFLTANVRALRWIINLRTAPNVLKEFRILCHELFNAVPDEFKYLLKDCVHEETQS